MVEEKDQTETPVSQYSTPSDRRILFCLLLQEGVKDQIFLMDFTNGLSDEQIAAGIRYFERRAFQKVYESPPNFLVGMVNIPSPFLQFLRSGINFGTF
jgi:hypothetical protein